MTWLQRLWRRSEMERKLDAELRFHLDQYTSDLMARGVAAEDARRQARVELGGPEQVKENCRDARGTRWLEDLWADCRYAVRTLRRMPGFAVVALLTLALGTGATTVMFTVINGVLLKPVPYPEPDSLVVVQGHTLRYGDQNFAYLDFLDCRRESRLLAPMAAWLYSGGTVSEPGDPNYVDNREITADLFPVLGVKVIRGRNFLPEEDRPGGTPVVILSYGFWQQHFGGSPEAIGKAVVLDAKRYTVVGIAPAAFRLAGNEDGLFTPAGQNTAPYMLSRNAHPLGIMARLRPGVTLAQAQSELASIGRHLAGQHPDTNAGRSFVVQPLRPDAGDVGPTLWLLLGAVSLVLLIACANVASLLLARAVSRERELAIRGALGAGWGRLVRQCLTESAVLGLAGGVLGIVLAAVGLRPFVRFWPGSLPRAEEVTLDWQVFAFASGISLLSSLLFGLAPALRAPAHELERALRAGARTVVGKSRRWHSIFVVSEIALAMVLLVSAGMLGRTLLRLSSLDPGVNIRNVLVARTALSPATLQNPAKTRAAWEDLLSRASRVPGVESIAMVDTVPMREGNNQMAYWTSAALPPENQRPLAMATSVTPDYLKVMGIPLRAGRFFDSRDKLGQVPVVVIDDVLARSAFGGQSAIGKPLWIEQFGDFVKVIGVVGHVRHWGLAGDDQAPVRAQLYYPWAQVPDAWVRRWSELMSLAVRTSIPPLGAVEPLRRVVRGVGNDQVLYEVRTMEQLAGGTLARHRFLSLLFSVFAGLALLLACVGIYGVLAYLMSQRVPEIGVRMALGASSGEVMWMVLRQSLKMVFAGSVIGVLAALAASRVLERAVEGMQATEPLTFALMAGILAIAALLASMLPARRASRIDPLSALRQE